MNGLQSGSPASLLAPQSYKNSSQASGYQNTVSGSDIQQSSSDSYSVNTLKPTTLKVVDSGNSSAVLGISSVAVAQTTQNVASRSNAGSVMFGVIFLAVSLGLAIYFVYKYKKLAPVPVDEEE